MEYWKESCIICFFLARVELRSHMVAGKNGADDLYLRTNKLVAFPLSNEGALFTVRSLVIDMNFGLVTIPGIVATGQAFDVALMANGIVGGNEDCAEDFDRARNDSRRGEETCRPASSPDERRRNPGPAARLIPDFVPLIRATFLSATLSRVSNHHPA
jgi:hypothetical protein